MTEDLRVQKYAKLLQEEGGVHIKDVSAGGMGLTPQAALRVAKLLHEAGLEVVTQRSADEQSFTELRALRREKQKEAAKFEQEQEAEKTKARAEMTKGGLEL